MLDKLRQQSRSLIIWFLFGIIILSFVVTFGPASMRLSCGGATKAGTLAGREISNADLQYALRLRMPPNAPPTVRAAIYDMLLQREILAQEAERLGFEVSEEEIAQMITKRHRIIALGQDVDLTQTQAWPQQRNAEGKLVPAQNYYHDQFKRWVQFQLSMKVSEFMEQQRKELLARRASDIILNGVIVSDREAMARFEVQNHSLQLDYARFPVDDFKKGVLVERAELMRWLSEKENRDRVDELYKKVKWKLTGLPLERRVRHILVALDPKASDADKKLAQDKIAKLREGLVKAPTDFPKMALALSQDEATKPSGGDLGWREKDKLGLGKDFAEAVFALKPMTVSAVLTSDKGLHLALVEGERKGDVSMEEARVTLAEDTLVEQKATAAARQVAEEALRRLNLGQNMETVFPPKEDAAPEPAEPENETASPKPSKATRWHPLLPTPQQVTVLRSDSAIGQIGKVEGLVSKVWQLTEQTPVLGEVVTVPGSGTSLGALAVVRLKSKTTPSKESFEANKEQIVEELSSVKQDDALKRWVYQRCEALRAEGKIELSDHVANIPFYQGEGESKKKTVFKYVPCQTLSRFGTSGSQFNLQ
ncbi:MAG: peptidylprolyl isomerase [Polyangia bacterium]|jgi:peptidyl-prolyl cis-trans isomerase D|nr:peptidylprolyl isomerase [Polyangia bacterium]